jgi:hypothetical protein
MGAQDVRTEVRRDEEMSNHLARVLAVGLSGGGGIRKSTSCSPRDCQSRRAQCGTGGGRDILGGDRVITIGTWSEPVDGRGVSHDCTKGAREGFAKARSRTDGLPTPLKGKRVYTPGVLRREKGVSNACSKYVDEIA